MIDQIRIQNCKALRDVKINLTPIHVLIGPNDSGKTSILEAIAALCRSVDHVLAQAFTGSWEGRQLAWLGEPNLPIVLSALVSGKDTGFDYTLTCSCAPSGRKIAIDSERFESPSTSPAIEIGLKAHPYSRVYHTVDQGHRAPDNVAQAASLIHDALALCRRPLPARRSHAV